MKFILCFIVATFCASSFANHFIHLKAPSRNLRTELSSIFHIDSVIEDSVYAIVSDYEFKKILSKHESIIVETHPITNSKSIGEPKFPEKDRNYHTYREMTQKLKTLVAAHSDIASLFSLGKTKENREMWTVKLSSNWAHSQLPGLFLVGGHHAREHLSTEIPIGVLAHILKRKNDSNVKALLSSRELYILPMLNADGASFDIRGGNYAYWRKNRKPNTDGSFGVDLNRNYDHEWSGPGSSQNPRNGTYHGPHAFSEKESSGIKKFLESHPLIRTMISYHTYSEYVLYPWSGRKESVGGREEAIFKRMAKKLSASTGYRAMQSSSMYVSTGDTCDWAYEAHGVYCFTYELSPRSFGGGGFYPGDIIQETIKKNIESVMYLWTKAGNPSSAGRESIF